MYKILNITTIALLFIMIVIAITNQTEVSLLGLILSKMMYGDIKGVK